MIGAAIWVAYSHKGDLDEGVRKLGQLKVGWLLLAILFQAQSMMVFARLQRWLLRAGGVRLRIPTMVEITLAGNAMGTTLPGGAAWAAAWAFGQLRRRGADRILAGWVLLVAGALASFAIFVILVVGAWVAGSSGPVRGFRWPALGLALIPVAAFAVLVAAKRSEHVRSLLGALWRWGGTSVRHGEAVEAALSHLAERVRAVRPSPLGWLEAFGFAMLNWLADCATLVCSLLAVGAHVPWHGILVTYGLVQVSASLPITPGGIGVVEGSLAALLFAYGMPLDTAFAGTLLYRIVSFWGLVPLGWVAWGYLELKGRRTVARPHPWAVHQHAGSNAGASVPVASPRLLRPSPCIDCDEPEPVGASAGRREPEDGAA
jgi:uncharacterized protein (TIRG00374 family)